MNQYGEMARRHWARWLPGRFAAIENPETFFTSLGDKAGQRITALAWELAGTTRRARDTWTRPAGWGRPGTGPSRSCWTR